MNRFIKKIDEAPLGFIGIGVMGLIFLFYAWLGEDCVFEVHDQLDETICAYVFMARHLFEGLDIYPEMMGGITPGGNFPSAVLFVPLYRIFPVFWAFLIQYFLVSITAFGGMYGLLKKVTNSSGVALVVGIIYALLPIKPVYGLSVAGVPLLILCFLQLYKKEHKLLSILGILYFALTTHLVLIGYVVLTYLVIFAGYNLCRKKGNIRIDIWFYAGIAILLIAYCVVNYEMFIQFFGSSSDFVSHREEFVNNTENISVWQNMLNMFLYGESHYAPSYHFRMLPICAVVTLMQGIRYKKLTDSGKKIWKMVVFGWVLILINIVMYGLFTSEFIMAWKNEQTGFFRYFRIDRYYLALPSLWWLHIGLCLTLVWKEFVKWFDWIKLLILIILVIPTLMLLKTDLVLYDNVNGYNHNSAFTGKPTWQEYYMQDVLVQVDEYIGRDKSQYRVGHVGLSPAPSLVYGFYTIDGYSNNYSLEYKHSFREIIADELDKSPGTKGYFDGWGSRCYLFSAESGSILKSADFKYQNLEYDIEAMKELGCEYIFASGEITGNTEGLVYEGTFDTEESIYEIWLYRIK